MTSQIRLAIEALVAAQQSAMAFVSSAEVALRLLSQPASDSAESESPSDTPCPHPRQCRVDTRAMGHPSRFKCTKCGEEVE